MKLRKTLAFVVAFAMIASMVPALGLTASAAVNDAIILADGKTALIQKSDNLIVDGGFEDDGKWQDALTTGKYILSGAGVVNFGKDGVDGVAQMNRDPLVSANLGDSFTRVTPGADGTGSALSVAISAVTGGVKLNGANGPASIKHYIANESSSEKTYYVSFYAKSLLEEGTSFKYYIGGIGASDAIPADVSAASVKNSDWTKIEKVVNVKAGQQLIVNIFNIEANAVAFDDFVVCEAESNADSKAFSEAMEAWDASFPYKDGQTVNSDMQLPTELNGTSVTWSSSKPEVISNDGKVVIPADSTSVVLTAEIKAGSFVATKKYTFTVIGFGDKVADALKSLVPTGTVSSFELPYTVPGYEGSTVTWKSARPDIISDDGKYSYVDELTTVELTATITYGGATFDRTFSVAAGTMVPNGNFATSDLSGWTSRANGAIEGAEVVYDSELGKNVLHVSGVQGKSARSIGTAWTVTPGREYALSFDVKITAGKDGDPAIADNNVKFNKVSDGVGVADDPRYTDVSSNIIIDYGNDIKNSSGVWMNFSKTFRATTDAVYFQASWIDDIKIANVALRPTPSDFTTEVTINYLDRNGNPVKEARVVKNIDGNNDGSISYSVLPADLPYIIMKDGKAYAYDFAGVTEIAVKESGNVINLYYDQTANLISNGNFEKISEDGQVYGWNVGTGGALTTANFEYVTEANGNHYIKSKGHGGSNSADSICTYFALEPNKTYTLSFKMWYLGSGTSYESYTGTYLVDSMNAPCITDAATAIERKNATGGLIPDAGDQLKGLTSADGWQQMNTTLTTNDTYSTLLIVATWLNATGNGNTSGYWGFDDFILQEVTSDYTADVVINYLSAEDKKTVLKAARTESGCMGETTYFATSEDKADIVVGDVTYVYDKTSVDNVLVDRSGNVINLYFAPLAAESVEPVVVDTKASGNVKLPETVKVTYNDGSVREAAVEWEAVPALEAGNVYEVKGTAMGLEAVATVNVFFGDAEPENYDDYAWINYNGVEYPIAKENANLIPNGDFETGTTEGWTYGNNGNTGALNSEYWIAGTTNVHGGEYALTNLKESQGGNSNDNLQTYFPIESGKLYYFGYWEYINQNEAAVGDRTMDAEGVVSSMSVTDGTSFLTQCGGFSSWTISPRTRAKTAGWTHRQMLLDTTNTPEAKYVVVAYSWTKDNTFALDDFELYAIEGEAYDPTSVQAKLIENIDGVVTEKLIDKGSALPNYANQYPGATVVVEGDTNKPVVKVTVTTGAPAFKSSIAIMGDKAVIYAVDEAVAGTAVVAQYAENTLLEAKSQSVNVAAGSTTEIAIVPVEGATAVRVMVVKALDNMVPVVKSTGATIGSYAPAVITPSDESQADSGYRAACMFDGDMNTRWTSQLYKEDNHCFFILDFGQEISVSEIALAFNNNGRNTVFKLGVSSDGKTYENVFDGKSSEKNANIDVSGKTFRYVKYDGFGNDNAGDPKWTAINEIVIK